MRRALCLILAAVVLAALSCESITPSPPNPLAIVRAAEENLRAVSSFHISMVAEEDGIKGWAAEADINPPDRGRFVIQIPIDPTSNVEIQVTQIGKSNYTLYPGFQAWFDVGWAALYHPSNLQGFPYDLAALIEAADGFDIVGEEVLDGVTAYRLTVIGSPEVRLALGLPRGVGAPKAEMWISQSDLLLLRIEARVQDPETMSIIVYSDYGSDVDVSVPENVIKYDLIDRFMEWTLSPEELGQVVRALPVPGQQCIEAEIGADVYREVIAGDSEAHPLVLTAFNNCESEILPNVDEP